MRRVARPIDPALASVLQAQNAAYETSPAREAHLRALRTGACAVVTGQQTGLFLGPLYTVYKAASTIRLARALSERWSAPVVPIFWLQTEDHDAAEIAVCHVARGSDPPLTLRLPVAEEAVSVAQRVLPAAVSERLSTLSETLARLPHGEEHLDCLARHYRPGAGWAEAFAGVMATLFAEEGLVMVDPRDPALAPLSAPVHRRALDESGPIARALTERVLALEAAGFHAGVHVRDGAPLSFLHPDGPAGPRCRLAPAKDGFVEVGGTRRHTLAELIALLEREPARFSTSALLRPILQDSWLPTVAYVGGPGEIAYFAQLSPLYAAFELTMPIVVPRAQFRLVERPTRDALARRRLTPAAACKPFDEALASATGAGPNEATGPRIAQQIVDGMERAFEGVAPQLQEAGERGERALAKTRRSIAHSADKLGRSVDRARILRDRDAVDDVRRIQARLLPGGAPQERFFGLSSFAARHGQRAVIERVLAAAEPLTTGFGDIDL